MRSCWEARQSRVAGSGAPSTDLQVPSSQWGRKRPLHPSPGPSEETSWWILASAMSRAAPKSASTGDAEAGGGMWRAASIVSTMAVARRLGTGLSLC